MKSRMLQSNCYFSLQSIQLAEILMWRQPPRLSRRAKRLRRETSQLSHGDTSGGSITTDPPPLLQLYCNLQRLIRSFAICSAPANVFAIECKPPGTQVRFRAGDVVEPILTNCDGRVVVCAAKYQVHVQVWPEG